MYPYFKAILEVISIIFNCVVWVYNIYECIALKLYLLQQIWAHIYSQRPKIKKKTVKLSFATWKKVDFVALCYLISNTNYIQSKIIFEHFYRYFWRKSYIILFIANYRTQGIYYNNYTSQFISNLFSMAETGH